MGIYRAMVLIGNARQATSERKSGPVETGLTRLAVMALLGDIQMHKEIFKCTRTFKNAVGHLEISLTSVLHSKLMYNFDTNGAP